MQSECSESNPQLVFFAYSGMDGPTESGQFPELPEAVYSCLPFVLEKRSLQYGIFSSEETA